LQPLFAAGGGTKDSSCVSAVMPVACGRNQDNMYTIYHVNADKLDNRFLEALKTAFRNKQIEITVSETDETDYLFRSPANRERLLKAAADVDTGRNLLTPDQTPFR
jgi:antitoxin YefM